MNKCYLHVYRIEKEWGGVFYIGGGISKKIPEKNWRKNKLGYKFVLIKFGD